MKSIFNVLVLLTLSLVFLLPRTGRACDPATQAAFNAALAGNYNPNGFGPTNFQGGGYGCCGGSGVGLPVQTMSYQSSMSTFALPVRTMTYSMPVGAPLGSCRGFGAPVRGYGRGFNSFNNFNNFGGGSVSNGGFGGGSININARRIRNNNFGALGAAAANGANVNINARRIRRNNF